MSRKAALSSVTDKKPFPSCLRALMKNNGTTQAALAEKLGVTRQTVSNYQTGQSDPDLEKLGKIADYFHVSSDYLLGRTEIKSPETNMQAVCEFLNLSQEAVSWLQEANNPNFFSILAAGQGYNGMEKYAHIVMDKFLSKPVSYLLFLHLAVIQQRAKEALEIAKEYDENKPLSQGQAKEYLSVIKNACKNLKLSMFELTENIRDWADSGDSGLGYYDASIKIGIAETELELRPIQEEINHE